MPLPETAFREGDRVNYAIGRTRAGRPIYVKHVYTFVRYAAPMVDADGALGERAIVLLPPDEPLHPNEEEEVWAIRLTKVVE